MLKAALALQSGLESSLILFHIYFFTLNELKDIEFDKKSKDLSAKPLVDGSIKIKNARYIIISSVILVLIFSAIFFYDQTARG